MSKFRFLSEDDLPTLLEYASKQGITVHSRISLPIVQADIAHVFKLSRFKYQFGDYSDIYSSCISVTYDDHIIIKYFETNDIPYKYLRQSYWKEAVAILISEYRGPVRNLTTSPKLIHLPVNPNYPYEISDEDYAKYMFVRIRQVQDVDLGLILSVSDLNILAKIAHEYGYRTLEGFNPHISERNRMVAYLDGSIADPFTIIKELQKAYDYPGRETILKRYIRELAFGRKGRFEFDNMITSDAKKLQQLGATPPIPDEKDIIYYNWKDIVRTRYAKEDQLSWDQVVEMVSSKSPELANYDRNTLLETLGMENVTVLGQYPNDDSFPVNNLAKNIQDMITTRGFRITSKNNQCSSQRDTLYDDWAPYIVIYGTLRNFVCYNIGELVEAFRGGQFIKPDQPNQLFSDSEINQLARITVEQDYRDPQLKDDLEFLEITISQVLGITYDPNTFIDNLNENEIDQFKILLQYLFEAGMYQRTWKGPGHPYPLKTEETMGSCLLEIEFHMTEPLSKIDEIIKENYKLGRAQMINEAEPLLIYPDTIWSFISTTIEGNLCVGGGSALMIETAYFYLKKLGLTIPDFDYDEFERESTHR